MLQYIILHYADFALANLEQLNTAQEGKTRTVICRKRRKDRPYEVVLVQQA
jgi:hypothetical protein